MSTSVNPLIAAWQDGRRVMGLFATMPGSIPAEVMARERPDYVCIDYQHGLIDHGAAIAMMQGVSAGGSVAVARPPWNEPAAIMATLDAGAVAVIIPMVNTVEEARAAVRACRFPPLGTRSYGPTRARYTMGGGDIITLDAVACFVMIETLEALENVDAIASVPGLTGLYIGPTDLGIAMGLPLGEHHLHPDMLKAMATVRDAADRAGIVVGVHSPNGEVACSYWDLGFDMVTVGTDIPLFAAAIRAELAKVSWHAGQDQPEAPATDAAPTNGRAGATAPEQTIEKETS